MPVRSRLVAMREEIKVESYSGYRLAERPKNFTWRGEKYEILEIKRQWIEERGQSRKRYFEVLTCPSQGETGGVQTRLISYDEKTHRWFIER